MSVSWHDFSIIIRETIEMYKHLNNLNRGKGEQLSLYLSATVPVKGEAAWLNVDSSCSYSPSSEKGYFKS